MNSRALIVIGCVALAGAGIVYLLRPAAAPTPASTSAPAAAPTGATASAPTAGGKPPSLPAPTPQSAQAVAKQEPGAVTLRTETNVETVFQRAFWRRPGPDVRILNGERREWADGNNVQQWQWFLAVQSTPEFRRWLLEQNPFELVRAEQPVEPARLEKPAPAWFPEAAARAQMTQYRAPGGKFTVYLDAKSGRLFATDAGAGFAAPVHN